MGGIVRAGLEPNWRKVAFLLIIEWGLETRQIRKARLTARGNHYQLAPLRNV